MFPADKGAMVEVCDAERAPQLVYEPQLVTVDSEVQELYRKQNQWSVPSSSKNAYDKIQATTSGSLHNRLHKTYYFLALCGEKKRLNCGVR